MTRPALIPDLRLAFQRKLGRCTACIRGSILGSGLAWGTLLVAVLLQAPALMIGALLALSAAFTVLALAHALAYGRRIAEALKLAQGEEQQASRRAFSRDVLKYAAGGLAFAVAGPLLKPSPAYATHCGSCPAREGPAVPVKVIGGIHPSRALAFVDAGQRALFFCDGVCSQYRCPGGLCEHLRHPTISALIGRLTIAEIPGDPPRFRGTYTVTACRCACRPTVFQEPSPGE